MQHLAEPAAAALKGCGCALQPKPREHQKKRNFSENVWSEAHVVFFGFTSVIFGGVLTSKNQKTQGFLFSG